VTATRYVAFLRAINVGGHTVKMDRLRALFEELRFANVETFIASGNVLFDTAAKDIAAVERKIEKHLEAALGYEVTTFLRPLAALPSIAEGHPYGAIARGHALNVGFLKGPPGAQVPDALARLTNETNEFHLRDREAYWMCRGRTSDSGLLNNALQKALGAVTTFRNVNTVQRLAAKA
jgi:uncharacterized protein (DUF1697 family)